MAKVIDITEFRKKKKQEWDIIPDEEAIKLFASLGIPFDPKRSAAVRIRGCESCHGF